MDPLKSPQVGQSLGQNLRVVTDELERAEIYVVNVDTSKLRRLTSNRASDRSPNRTQDGRIIFSSDRAGPSRLYMMNSERSCDRPDPEASMGI